MREAFAKTEREFLNMAGVEGWRDGTTAVCAVIQEGAGAGQGTLIVMLIPYPYPSPFPYPYHYPTPILSPPTSLGVKPTPAFDFVPSPREPPLLSPLELERLGDERGIGWRDGMRRFMGVALVHPAPTGLAPCNGR